MKYCRLLDTSDTRSDEHEYHSSSGSDMHLDRHRYYPYTRSDRGYFPEEFKKEKPPTFDGEMKKPQDAEAWFLGINNFLDCMITQKI